MVYQFSNAAVTIGLLLLAANSLAHPPVLAHKVEVTADVAGTWHVEPNHAPKAGEPAQVWIALTRKGGELLPLEQGNCQLQVYALPRAAADPPLLTPTLQAVSAEQYQGIPGAEVVFPKIGLYELELGCTPKTAGDFTPFQMSYEVTVATAASPPAASPLAEEPTAQPAQPNQTEKASQPQPDLAWGTIAPLIGLVGLGVAGLVIVKRFVKPPV
ncbi:MAG: hypothetical protein IGS54_22830 [Elainella sp. C42_A2020_010]|nr:hypothetical protein [Elainella sp. C42_A2020_010]